MKTLGLTKEEQNQLREALAAVALAGTATQEQRLLFLRFAAKIRLSIQD